MSNSAEGHYPAHKVECAAGVRQCVVLPPGACFYWGGGWSGRGRREGGGGNESQSIQQLLDSALSVTERTSAAVCVYLPLSVFICLCDVRLCLCEKGTLH